MSSQNFPEHSGFPASPAPSANAYYGARAQKDRAQCVETNSCLKEAPGEGGRGQITQGLLENGPPEGREGRGGCRHGCSETGDLAGAVAADAKDARGCGRGRGRAGRGAGRPRLGPRGPAQPLHFQGLCGKTGTWQQLGSRAVRY